MPIIIKNNEQIKKMEKAGKIVGRTLELLEKSIKIGMSTFELDKIAEEYILSNNAKPNFKGLYGFPSTICVSINNEIIHGIPSKKRILKDGDIVSVDTGCVFEEYNGDAARTFSVGNVLDNHKKLVERTRESFFYAIEFATEDKYLYEMSGRVEQYVNQFGYGTVREYIGHGIGKTLHESPEIPNFIQKRKGPKLTKGMTLCLEPMINEGSAKIKNTDDGWTVVTADGKWSAHYENTILITDGKPEILTLS